ncbi:hypothetical protein ACFL1E_00860 [Candidatus Omnitrophota bacterium]
MGKVYKYYNQQEALKIEASLKSENIPVEIHSFENWGYDGVFRHEVGMGEVIVPDEYEKRAKAIISEVLKEFKHTAEDMEFKIIKLRQSSKSVNGFLVSAVISILIGLSVTGYSVFISAGEGIIFLMGCLIIFVGIAMIFNWKKALKDREKLKRLSEK